MSQSHHLTHYGLKSRAVAVIPSFPLNAICCECICLWICKHEMLFEEFVFCQVLKALPSHREREKPGISLYSRCSLLCHFLRKLALHSHVNPDCSVRLYTGQLQKCVLQIKQPMYLVCSQLLSLFRLDMRSASS